MNRGRKGLGEGGGGAAEVGAADARGDGRGGEMTRTGGAGKKVAAEDAAARAGTRERQRRGGGRGDAERVGSGGRRWRGGGGAAEVARTGGAGKKVAAEDAGGTRGDEGEGSGEEEEGGMQRGSGREGGGGAADARGDGAMNAADAGGDARGDARGDGRGGAMTRTGGAGKKVAAEDVGGTRGDEGEGSGEEEEGGMRRGSGREGRGGAAEGRGDDENAADARGDARGEEEGGMRRGSGREGGGGAADARGDGRGRGDDENGGDGEEEGESVEGGAEELEAERRRVLQLCVSGRGQGTRAEAAETSGTPCHSVRRGAVRLLEGARNVRARAREGGGRGCDGGEKSGKSARIICLHPCFFCSPTNAMARTSATRRRVVVAVAFCRLCRAAQQQIDVHVANGDRSRALRAIRRCPKPQHQSELHLRNRGLYARDGVPGELYCCAAVPTTTYNAFSVGTISPAQFKSALRVKLGVAEDVSKRREAYDLCDARGQTHLWFFFIPTRQRYRIAFAAVPDATSVIASIGASCALVLSCAFARVFSPSSPASANRERKLYLYTPCLGACRIVYGDFAPVVYLQPFLETFVE
ncbi:hypothetical protein B0H16DRAFT_1474557 [Mycena metata]|uniref:Uncharacterized protein n=1 Tax=Mycena metata TaxID=1033252 RepID=A0AAD7HGL9_9AGAR|nr:hypothetical protein B0H16DRAFT_1474557 [Mycena metata]